MEHVRVAERGRETDRRVAGTSPAAALRPLTSLAAQGATARHSTHIAASLGPGFAPSAAHRSSITSGVAGVAKPALMSVSRVFAASIVPRPVPQPGNDSTAATPIRRPLPVVSVSRGSSVLEAVRHAAPATGDAGANTNTSTSGHKRPRLLSASALLLASAVEDDGPPSSKHRRIVRELASEDDDDDDDPIASGSDHSSEDSDGSSCTGSGSDDDDEDGRASEAALSSGPAASAPASGGFATLSALFEEADTAAATAAEAGTCGAAAAAASMDDLLAMMRQEKASQSVPAPSPLDDSADLVVIDDDDGEDSDDDDDAADDEEDDVFCVDDYPMPPLTRSVVVRPTPTTAATGGASSSSSSSSYGTSQQAVGGGAAASAAASTGRSGLVQPSSGSSRRSASTASAFSAASSASSVSSVSSSSVLSFCAASVAPDAARAGGSGGAGATASILGGSDDDEFEQFLSADAGSDASSSADDEDDGAAADTEDEAAAAKAEKAVLRRFACTCSPRGRRIESGGAAAVVEAAADAAASADTTAGATSSSSSSSSSVSIAPTRPAVCRACLAVRIRRVYVQFCAIEREWSETAPIQVFNHTKKCLNDGCGVEGANRPGTMHPAPLAVAMIASGMYSRSRLYDVGAGWGQAMALASAFTGCLADGDELHEERASKGHAVIGATCKCLGALKHVPAGLGCTVGAACKARHATSVVEARGERGFDKWQAEMAAQASDGSSSSSSAAAVARVTSVHQSLAILQKTTVDASPAARAERDALERFVMGLTPAALQVGASADLKVQQKLMLQLAKVLALGRNRDTLLEPRREPICELLSLRAGDVLHAQRKCKSTLSMASVVLINNYDNAWQENGSTVQNRVMRLLARVLPRGAIVVSLSPFTRLSTRRTRTTMKNTSLVVAGSSYSNPSMYFEVCSGWPALDPDLYAAEAAFLSEHGVRFTSKDSAEWAFPEEFLDTDAFDSWVDAVFDGGKSMPTMAAVTHMLEHVCKPCDRNYSVE